MANQTLAYITLSGIPLQFDFEWPFHKSTSGGDFHVLHGVVHLADGSGLHADIAVHLSLTVVDKLPSLDEKDARNVVVNALRKETDRKQLEFLRSGKRQPIPLSSRFLNFKQGTWSFEHATEEQISQAVLDKIFWVGTRLSPGPVLVADPCDSLYLGTTTAKLFEVGKRLEQDGLFIMRGDLAHPSPALEAKAAHFEQRAQAAIEAVQQKHAYEQAR